MACYPKTDMPKPQSLNILSLDGGGVSGALSATFIERIHNEFPNFLRDTDLIVGTSAGGIQALGLAAGINPKTIKSFYQEKIKQVFTNTFVDDGQGMWGSQRADYSNTPLKEILHDLIGDVKLYELNKKVCVVTYDLDNRLKDFDCRTWKPKIYHNYNEEDSNESAVDVALKTSATPTYFSTYKNFCDGGVVANNPALIGVCQVLDRRSGPQVSLPDIKVLSLGTGKVNKYIEGEDLDWGIAQWAPHLLYILMGGTTDIVNFQCDQLLGQRFHRLDSKLAPDFDRDDWKKIPGLVRIGTDFDLEETYEWVREFWV